MSAGGDAPGGLGDRPRVAWSRPLASGGARGKKMSMGKPSDGRRRKRRTILGTRCGPRCDGDGGGHPFLRPRHRCRVFFQRRRSRQALPPRRQHHTAPL